MIIKEFPKAAYSPVCNVSIIRALIRDRYTQNYFLFLAHDILNNEYSYKELRSNLSAYATVILDNSLIELGNAVDYHIMDRAAKFLCPDFIILPDVLLNKEATLKSSSEVYKEWQQLLRPTQLGNISKFMAVLQGQSIEEMIECAKEYIQLDHDNCIGAFGIPRAFANKVDSRSIVIHELYKYEQLCKPVHLLGFSNNLRNDLNCAKIPLVMGIDSATPIRLGAENIKIGIDTALNIDPASYLTVDREIFFKDFIDLEEAMIYNIGFIKGYLKA